MKKILFFLTIIVLVFTSCSKDDEPSLTTYTFNYELGDYSLIVAEVILFEYSSGGEKVANTQVECYNGLSKKITANEKSEKVKVYLKMQEGSVTLNTWVQQVFYLKKSNDINITVNEEIIIGTKEP